MAAPPDLRVDNLLDLFASVCHDGRWRGVAGERPDQVNHHGGIDAVYTAADGAILAIEHTLIEPFAGNQADVACLERRFAPLEQDVSLLTPSVVVNVRLARFQTPPVLGRRRRNCQVWPPPIHAPVSVSALTQTLMVYGWPLRLQNKYGDSRATERRFFA